jgi:hypothetical protein
MSELEDDVDEYSNSSRTDEWILALFDGYFDPCPYDPNWSSGVNGIFLDWKPRTFVNPPYSNVRPWVEKAIIESQKGNFVVMLLKHDSSTAWFRLLMEHGAHFIYPHGRLKYQTGRSAAWPSMLVVLS